MFLHQHPYKPFLYKGVQKIIVGTLPTPRFSTGKLKPHDVPFCYGSQDGLLWKIVDEIFGLKLSFENTFQAVEERKLSLKNRKLGICDIVESCERLKINASDLGMQNIQLRNLIHYLNQYPSIKTLLFTGGNSKNGPEYLFKKHIKKYAISFDLISDQIPRIHIFYLNGRKIKTISLTAPSGSANRAIGSYPEYKEKKALNSKFNTFNFRVEQYKTYF
ncbi:MAG: uracil-DNA glycosylase family protein [Flavobacteriales bacterium]